MNRLSLSGGWCALWTEVNQHVRLTSFKLYPFRWCHFGLLTAFHTKMLYWIHASSQGKRHTGKLIHFCYVWVNRRLNRCAVLFHVQHICKYARSKVSCIWSVRECSYSPGTTGLWTWDRGVRRKRPSFSSVSTPVALPMLPKKQRKTPTDTVRHMYKLVKTKRWGDTQQIETLQLHSSYHHIKKRKK